MEQNNLNRILGLGRICGIFPYPLARDWKLRSWSLVQIYAILVMIFNAISNLDICRISSVFIPDQSLSLKFVFAAIVWVRCTSDFYIRSNLILRTGKMSSLIQRLKSLRKEQKRRSANTSPRAVGARKIQETCNYFLIAVLMLLSIVMCFNLRDWCVFKADFQSQRQNLIFIPKLDWIYLSTVMITYATVTTAITFACVFPIVVTNEIIQCYHEQIFHLDGLLCNLSADDVMNDSSGKKENLQAVRDALHKINLVKECFIKLNEVNAGLLIPLLSVKICYVGNLPYLLLYTETEQMYRLCFLLTSILYLAVPIFWGTYAREQVSKHPIKLQYNGKFCYVGLIIQRVGQRRKC